MNLIPIEDAVIDLDEVADKLQLGPQAELLEKIERFNNSWGRRNHKEVITINKKFGFKPGTYDRIKEAHAHHVLRYCSKPSSVYSLKDRIDKYRYVGRNFWDQAISIQRKMLDLKTGAINWQDNTELLTTFWNSFIERIINESGQVISSIPNTIVNVLVDNDDVEDSAKWHNMQIYLDVHVNNINLSVYKMDEVISVLDWGDVHLRWNIPIWKFMNAWCTYNENSGRPYNIVHNPIAKLNPKYSYLEHPYVTQYHRYNHGNEPFRHTDEFRNNTCTGDLQSAINTAAWSVNPHAIAILSRQWLSKYHIPHTNPLNRIEKCYYGFPLDSDIDLLIDHNPTSKRANCNYSKDYFKAIMRCVDHKERLIPDLVWRLEENNACDNCQFKDGYAYLRTNMSMPDDSAYHKQEVMIIDPCNKRIVDYVGPETEEEALLEACRLQLTNARLVHAFADNFREEGYEYNSQDDTACLSISFDIIEDVLGEIYLEHAMLHTANTYHHYDAESLLDVVFNARAWNSLVNELADIMNEYDPPEEGIWEYEQIEDEWYGASLQDIRNEINRIQNPVTEQWNPEAIVEETLTPEERAIRWASSRGSAINI